MSIKVTKKDGTTEKFERAKIVNACKSAGASHEIADRVGMEIQAQVEEGVTTQEIRDLALQKLREVDPQLEASWLNYEKEKAGGSEEAADGEVTEESPESAETTSEEVVESTEVTTDETTAEETTESEETASEETSTKEVSSEENLPKESEV